MITASIITALLGEIKYFLNGVGTYILDVDVKDDIAYEMPLVIFELGDGGLSSGLPGNGITRMDYDISFRIYNFEPNMYDDVDGGFSAGLLDIIDKVRVFLCNEVWLTNEMKALTDNFGFRMEWQGLTKAEPIQSNENLVMGYKLNFESISFDQLTNASYDMLDQSGTVTGTVTFRDLSV